MSNAQDSVPATAVDPNAVDQAFTRTSPYGTRAEPTYSGALSFLRRRYTKDLDGVDVAVVGVPFDLATTNRPGTRLGPRAIRAASASLATGAYTLTVSGTSNSVPNQQATFSVNVIAAPSSKAWS